MASAAPASRDRTHSAAAAPTWRDDRTHSHAKTQSRMTIALTPQRKRRGRITMAFERFAKFPSHSLPRENTEKGSPAPEKLKASPP